jgi:hypothetical protein
LPTLRTVRFSGSIRIFFFLHMKTTNPPRQPSLTLPFRSPWLLYRSSILGLTTAEATIAFVAGVAARRAVRLRGELAETGGGNARTGRLALGRRVADLDGARMAHVMGAVGVLVALVAVAQVAPRSVRLAAAEAVALLKCETIASNNCRNCQKCIITPRGESLETGTSKRTPYRKFYLEVEPMMR